MCALQIVFGFLPLRITEEFLLNILLPELTVQQSSAMRRVLFTSSAEEGKYPHDGLKSLSSFSHNGILLYYLYHSKAAAITQGNGSGDFDTISITVDHLPKTI